MQAFFIYMTMKSFGQFLDDRTIHFIEEDIQVSIETSFLQLYEKHILGVDDSEHVGMKKYRVTFKYPKSLKMAKWGNYDDETRYILANSPQEAKERTIEFIRTKKMKRVEPGSQVKMPAPYLKGLNVKGMAIKVKQVENWSDFLDLVNYVIEKRTKNPIRYFSQDDLNIFLHKARTSKDFMRVLQNLSKEVQLLLKRIYLHTVGQELSSDNKNILDEPLSHIDTDRKTALDSSAKLLGKFYPTVKPKDPDEPPDVNEYSNFREILKEAKRYGLVYKDLKLAKEQIMQRDYHDIEERKTAWRDIRGRLARSNYSLQKQKNIMYSGSGQISPKNSMFQNKDVAQLDKFGGDDWTSELMRNYPWLRKYSEDPYAAVFEFYKKGMPKMPSLWYKALLECLYFKAQRFQPEEIPF